MAPESRSYFENHSTYCMIIPIAEQIHSCILSVHRIELLVCQFQNSILNLDCQLQNWMLITKNITLMLKVYKGVYIGLHSDHGSSFCLVFVYLSFDILFWACSTIIITISKFYNIVFTSSAATKYDSAYSTNLEACHLREIKQRLNSNSILGFCAKSFYNL